MINTNLASQANDIFTHLNKKEQFKPQEVGKNIQQPDWSPYIFNGGTVLGIGGPGFIIVAGDSRLSQGFSILSRDISKIVQINNQCVLATSGMYADFTALCKQLKARLQIYEYNNNKKPNAKSIACLLSRTLYYKRFFPYYTFNLLAGFDENGNGITYGYDAVGSYDIKNYVVLGSASQIIVPILDSQLEGYNKIQKTLPKTKEEYMGIIIDCFNSAAERDIYTGDHLEILVIEKGKEPIRSVHELRRD